MYIDIRNRNEYNLGHIDGAVNIKYINLLATPDKYLTKNDIYYIYCNTGNKSKYVVSKLNNLGFKCVNIDGGYYSLM